MATEWLDYWYDKECKSLKHVLNNISKHKKFNTRQIEYNILLRQYKQLIQKKKRHYQQVKLSQLENMRTEDPNAFFFPTGNLSNLETQPKVLLCHNLWNILNNKSTLLMLTIFTTIIWII